MFREFGRSQVVPRKIFRPLHKFMQGVFLINRKVHLLIKNRSAEDRTAAVGNNVAAGGESRERDSFLFNRKVHLLIKNRSAEYRTAAVNGTLL